MTNNSCIIVAQGKTGSTGLFHTLLRTQAWAGNKYEPKQYIPEAEKIEGGNFLTKIVLEDYNIFDQGTRIRMVSDIDKYKYKIWLIRDPRDRFVSGICYRGYQHLKDHPAKAAYYDLLVQKSEDPRSISCLELAKKLKELAYDDFDLIEDTRVGGRFMYEKIEEVHNPLLYRYEDFVSEEFTPLEKYLGLHGIQTALASEMKTRNKAIRKKAVGDWKHWFTEEDVWYFLEKDNFMLDYMRKFMYSIDRGLAQNPVIEPKYSYKYFKKLVGL